MHVTNALEYTQPGRERAATRPGTPSSPTHRTRMAMSLLAALTLFVWMGAGSAHAVTLTVVDADGVNAGTTLYSPTEQRLYVVQGALFEVSSRITAAASEFMLGVGVSYYAYDDTITAVSAVATPSLLPSVCISGLGAFGAFGVFTPVIGTAGFGAREGENRVRVAAVSDLTTHQYVAVASIGLNGICGDGDPDFSVRFDASNLGETPITIGTGDDLGGVIVDNLGATSQATNATLDVIVVPEPAFGAGLAGGAGLLSAAAARRRRD